MIARMTSPAMRTLLLSSELAIETDHQLLDDHHRDDDDDQPDDPVEYALEAHAFADGNIERFEDHELGSEQDQPRAEEAQSLPPAARLSLELARHPVLDRNRPLQKELEDDRCKHHRREGLNEHLVGVLIEQAEHDQVDECPDEVEQEKPLPVRRNIDRSGHEF